MYSLLLCTVGQQLFATVGFYIKFIFFVEGSHTRFNHTQTKKQKNSVLVSTKEDEFSQEI